ncbi:FAD-dependent oxidoreductase [Metabacillus sp. GX 13764]|uniref:dihydrolipoyl dehydrogenase family protein n=1 Tax=Metabacillus kandeliae TaxID=2900151 RepID=UPI001E599252|nr:FAD-dependent oxidoreductase [Metabacillus kandeliae]MCD7036481.1 FAD-dependent oxidoreductase [Metabacillus kandeliae]
MVVGELAQERDVIIIGGGPAGYTAAIRAAQLGREVTLIEKEDLGGICLNKGCIPSKVFSRVSAKFSEVKKLSSFGITAGEPALHFPDTQEYRKKTVLNLRKGVEALCRENKIEVLKGTASFLAAGKIGVENGDAFDIYRYQSALIAAGGILKPAMKKSGRILNARNLYEITELPEELLVYGDDYIAIEAAFSFQNMGSKVTVITEKGFSWLDAAVEKELLRQMKKAKIQVKKQWRLEDTAEEDGRVQAFFRNEAGEPVSLHGTCIYIQSEAVPDLKELGADRLGLELDEAGKIKTDSSCKTSISGIWAAGDIASGPMLAVKAIRQGKTAAESIAGLAAEYDGTLLPTVIHSQPPIAAAGMTEEEAAASGYSVKTGQFSLTGNGYASVKNEKDGLIKVISDEETEILLGIHIIGDGALELISTGITALEMAAREEDLTFPFYPHPSINEGLLEAVEALAGKAIHLVPKKTFAAAGKKA